MRSGGLALCILLQISLIYCGFLNEFVIHVKGGEDRARAVAEELGFEFNGFVDPLDDHYLLTHCDVPRRHKRAAEDLQSLLTNHPEVEWSEQQKLIIREKRHALSKALPPYKDSRLEREAYANIPSKFNDPLWKTHKEDWYLVDTIVTPLNSSHSLKTDLRVLPVWERGITGKGIVITILDDGLEWNHTDISHNYAAFASRDVNDNDPDPFPRYDWTNENKHGTRCAGVIAMKPNNNYCGVGIAPDCKVGAVRMLDGDISDRVEAASIGFNVRDIDIMSASWGPSDNGRQADGPGKLTSMALEKGISQGRKGKGTIYIWASGNGGHRGDNCACDGYVSHPYTISISSTSSMMKTPFYLERCPSTMATTFSSGAYIEGRIVSIDLHNKCTDGFTGTSAAAPQAAAIVALLLQFRPNLGWRDVQHLIVWTSHPYPLYNNPGWITNAAGFKMNHRFGFGLLSAIDIIEAAETWVNVGERLKCVVSTKNLPQMLNSSSPVIVHIDIPTDCEVNYIEHVELISTISYEKRGDVSLDLISAQGTNVSMMRPREYDYNTIGYTNWPFMSIQTWGENPHGRWQVIVFDDQSAGMHHGYVKNLTLRVWGTEKMPETRRKAADNKRNYEFKLENVVKQKLLSGDVGSSGDKNIDEFATALEKLGIH